MQKIKYIEYVSLAVLVVLVFYMYSHLQPLIDIRGGQGWDGLNYASMYNYFSLSEFKNFLGKGIEYAPSFPFNQRVLTPFLSSLLPFDMFISFKIVNSLFTLGTVLVMHYIVTGIIGLSRTVSLFNILWFTFHWISYPRLSNYYPLLIDPSFVFFLSLFLVLYIKESFCFLPLVTILGVASKESFLAVIILLALYQLFYIITGSRFSNKNKNKKRKELVYVTLSLIAGITTSVFIKTALFPSSGSSLLTVFIWIYKRSLDPLSLLKFIAAFFIAYGFFAILAVRNFTSLVSENNLFILIVSSVFISFGYIAGSDMTRILFNAYPFLIFLILNSSQKENKIALTIGFLLSLPLMYLTSAIPNAETISPYLEVTGYFSWLPEYAANSIVALWLLYFIIYLFIYNFIANNKWSQLVRSC